MGFTIDIPSGCLPCCGGSSENTAHITGSFDGATRITFNSDGTWSQSTHCYNSPTDLSITTSGTLIGTATLTKVNLPKARSGACPGESDSCNGSVSILQQPSTDNDYQTIILIDDTYNDCEAAGPYGAGDYDVTVTWNTTSIKSLNLKEDLLELKKFCESKLHEV